MKSIFPNSMLSKNKITCCTDVAAGLSYFYEQTHLFHLQTTSYSEHLALGSLYDCIGDFKDNVLERLMGYEAHRVEKYTIPALKSYSPTCAVDILKELQGFSCSLLEYAAESKMYGVTAITEEFSGMLAKTSYLLTLK